MLQLVNMVTVKKNGNNVICEVALTLTRLWTSTIGFPTTSSSLQDMTWFVRNVFAEIAIPLTWASPRVLSMSVVIRRAAILFKCCQIFALPALNLVRTVNSSYSFLTWLLSGHNLRTVSTKKLASTHKSTVLLSRNLIIVWLYSSVVIDGANFPNNGCCFTNMGETIHWATRFIFFLKLVAGSVVWLFPEQCGNSLIALHDPSSCPLEWFVNS